jgi:hypothetical protein
VCAELAASREFCSVRQTLNQKTNHNAIFTHEIERDAPANQVDDRIFGRTLASEGKLLPHVVDSHMILLHIRSQLMERGPIPDTH